MADFERSLKGINGEASVTRTTMAKVDLDSILDQRAYDSTKAERTKTVSTSASPPHLDPSVSTLTFDFERSAVDTTKFERFLQNLLWEKSFRGGDEATTVVLRAKGTLRTSGGCVKMLQAVQEVYELRDISMKANEDIQTRVVLIGLNLHRKTLQIALNACLC